MKNLNYRSAQNVKKYFANQANTFAKYVVSLLKNLKKKLKKLSYTYVTNAIKSIDIKVNRCVKNAQIFHKIANTA